MEKTPRTLHREAPPNGIREGLGNGYGLGALRTLSRLRVSAHGVRVGLEEARELHPRHGHPRYGVSLAGLPITAPQDVSEAEASIVAERSRRGSHSLHPPA